MAERDDAAPPRATPFVLVAWVVGLALLIVVGPWLRTRVAISDELDAAALIVPVWTLLQMALLSWLLLWIERRAAEWPLTSRALVATAAALGVGLLLPSTLSLASRVMSSDSVPLARDPLQVILLWSMPLLYYVAPSALVIREWLRAKQYSPMRALGQALVAIGLLNLVAILWLQHLWSLYSDV